MGEIVLILILKQMAVLWSKGLALTLLTSNRAIQNSLRIKNKKWGVRQEASVGKTASRLGTMSAGAFSGNAGRDREDLRYRQTCLLTICPKCRGEGKIIQPPSRKAKKRHKIARLKEENNNKGDNGQQQQHQQERSQPSPRIDGCMECQGSGLVQEGINKAQELACHNFPHVAIIGGGLGGLALAVACRHRSIPFTVYERDADFSQRSQGYGLTMQQASRALKALGIAVPLSEGIVSTKHVVHTHDGKVVGEWGLRKWRGTEVSKQKQATVDGTYTTTNGNNKRQNVHIARQSLRYELLKALGGPSQVQWGHRLMEYQEHGTGVETVFEVSNQDGSGNSIVKYNHANLLVGADGIRSTVRKQLLGEDLSPLRYLGCIVILGICPLSPGQVEKMGSPLLDGETVFQTADGSTRIYMMPYSKREYMWQLSFPMDEGDAKQLSKEGPQALKNESLKKCHSWHNPIVTILEHTPVSLVSGYPVYDRALLMRESFEDQTSSMSLRRVTLLGDACHPMSPFKGQGANQALLDALSLARTIYKTFSNTNTNDTSTNKNDLANDDVIDSTMILLGDILGRFEAEMLSRSSVKVKASAEAAKFLHTEVAIQEGNVTRGAAANTMNVL